VDAAAEKTPAETIEKPADEEGEEDDIEEEET